MDENSINILTSVQTPSHDILYWLPDAPEAPSDVTVVKKSSKHLELSWKADAIKNNNVQKYIIHIITDTGKEITEF